MQTLLTDTHVTPQRELKCFFLQTLLNHPTNLLGIGVHFDLQTQFLESDFNWLCTDAPELFCVRTSVNKKAIEFFLPSRSAEKTYESGKLFKYLEHMEEVVVGLRRQWHLYLPRRKRSMD